MKVHLPRFNLTGDVLFEEYSDGQNAFALRNDGELVAIATVNLDSWGVEPSGLNEVWVKCWSENEGMAEALADAGVVERIAVDNAWGGYGNTCHAVLMRLTLAAQAERLAQKGDLQ